MRRISIAVFLISGILLFLLSSGELIVSAADSGSELIRQMENELNVSVFYEKEAERLIKCFDINEDGCFAVGFRNNTIYVYDSFGVFQYGYRFDTDNVYAIALNGNNIVIYLNRSHIAVEIDPTGKCVGAEEVHFSLVADAIKRTHKQMGSAEYYLERDIGIFDGDYSRLVKMDEKGTQTVLYDETIRGYFVGVCHYILLSIFPIVGIAAIALRAKKEQRKTG